MGTTTENLRITIILECVESDLKSIKQSDFSNILTKMQSLPQNKLESVLEILNMHVVDNMIHENKEKKTSKVITHNAFQVV